MLGEEVPGLDAQRPRDLAERPEVGLALAVLDGVDGLRGNAGLSRQAPNAETPGPARSVAARQTRSVRLL